MTAQLLKIDDPRSPLEKAKRYEIYRFAKQNGIEVTEDMPAILMRAKLRAANITNIKIPNRTLGKIEQRDAPQVSGNENLIDAEADLARQFDTASKPQKQYSDLSRAELAKECKSKGIKFERTAKKEKLVELLGG